MRKMVQKKYLPHNNSLILASASKVEVDSSSQLKGVWCDTAGSMDATVLTMLVSALVL